MNEMIQWPKASYWNHPFNPYTGCKPVSPACENCYACAIAKRFNVSFEPHEAKAQKPPRKGVVFCGNFTDLWGDWLHVHGQYGYYHKACDYIAESIGYNPKNKYKDKAVYLWLTKRVKNMAETLAEGGWEYNKDYWSGDADVCEFKDCDLSNQYFGFTGENQEWYDRRVVHMKNWPEWVNTWVSCEPLLGPIDLDATSKPIYKWVVVGAESGLNRRPCKLEWVESIVEQCRSAGVPVFVKQIVLPSGKFTNKIEEFPKHLQIRQVPWAKGEH